MNTKPIPATFIIPAAETFDFRYGLGVCYEGPGNADVYLDLLNRFNDSPVIRTVILEFPTNQLRSDFICSLNLTGYTLHNEKPVLYCKLAKPEIELAIKRYQAKDTSYNDTDNPLLNSFLDIFVF